MHTVWLLTCLKLSSVAARARNIRIAAFRRSSSTTDSSCGRIRSNLLLLTSSDPKTNNQKRLQVVSAVGAMETNDNTDTTTNGEYTTNAVDQAEAARLKEYLANDAIEAKRDNVAAATVDILRNNSISFVSIDEGKHKYVLMKATVGNDDDDDGKQQLESHMFVISRRGAHYHRNVAEWYIPKLQNLGFSKIEIQGGGRIIRDDLNKKIKVFGYSYGFGQADHLLATRVIRSDKRFRSYDVTWSNDGY